MTDLGLSGLASGVDTSAIVEKLMAIESQSLTRIKLRQSQIQARDTGLRDVQSKLTALKSAATALKASSLWTSSQAAESSLPANVGVEAKGGAGIGASTIIVSRLANSTQRTYAFTPNAAASTLTVTPSGGSAITVAVAAGASADDVAAAINARSDLNVYAASIVPNPATPTVKQLVLSSRETGAATNFTATSSAGGQLSEVTANYRAGVDAQYKLNGSATVKTSASNVVDNAIPGVRLTLKQVSTTAVTVNVTPPTTDTSAVKTALHTFVNAYNAVVGAVRDRTTEKAVPDATTTSDALKGQLFADSSLTALLGGLRRAVSDTVAANPTAADALADLGITTGAIGAGDSATSGTLTIDDAKLNALLTANPAGVRQLLGGAGAAGIGDRFAALVDTQVGTGKVLDSRLASSATQQQTLAKSATDTQARLTQRETRLKAQFAAMESALLQSQSQQAWLTSQISSLG